MNDLLLNNRRTKKRRAMTSSEASRVKRAGHAAEERYAKLIGGKKIAGTRKKDIRDSKEFTHSVKSGKKKWQIFLYRTETINATFFGAVKESLLACINALPPSFADYHDSGEPREQAKARLAGAMRKLRENLEQNERKKEFLNRGFFNGGEVDFLAIEDGAEFHIFARDDALPILDDNTRLENSRARRADQHDAQKVIFKINDVIGGEIEMRADSPFHYREIKFWMSRPLVFNLLKTELIGKQQTVAAGLVAYGKAVRHIGALVKLIRPDKSGGI